MYYIDILLIFGSYLLLLFSIFRIQKLYSVFLLLAFDFLFLYFIFGSQISGIVTTGPGVLVFTPLLVFNLHIVFLIILGKSKIGAMLSLCPVLLCLIPSQAFIIPAHPLILLYGISEISDFLPRFSHPLINTFLLYFLPVVIVGKYPTLRFAAMLMLFAIFITNLYIKEHRNADLKTLRVLIVQVGMYVDKGHNIDNIMNDIDQYSDVDVVVFSESTEFGAKRGARRMQTEALIRDLQKRSGKTYILSLYGYSDNGIDYNYRSSLFIEGHHLDYYPKLKLVPGWETRGFLYRDEDFSADYLATPSSRIKKVHKLINSADITTYSCFEAFFYPLTDRKSSLNVIQSRYTDIKSDSFSDFNRSIIFGNILSYFMLSPDYTPLLSVQDSGGSVYIDRNGTIDHGFFQRSLESPFVRLDISMSL